MGKREQQTSGRGYADATVPRLPDHGHSDNRPVSDKVSKDSKGNPANMDHWKHRATHHSDHRDHPDAAKTGHGARRDGDHELEE
jgi:hypothetical protein